MGHYDDIRNCARCGIDRTNNNCDCYSDFNEKPKPKPKTGKQQITELMQLIEYQYPHGGQHTFSRCDCDKHIQRGYGPCAYCLESALAKLIDPDAAAFFHRRVRKLSDLYHSIVNGVDND